MIKVNIGCGKRNFGKDWIHIDKEKFSHIDHHDILNFPYENIDLLYASHLLSYFDRDQINVLLSYWRSKMVSNGTLRIAVPNFEKMSLLYNSGWRLDYFLGPLYGKMVSNGDIIFHKTCFDKESLSKILKENGFKNIREWDHKKVDHGKFDDHSQAYLPHMDKEKGILISLNLEGTKDD